jgi:hypothetical protein
MNFNELIEKAWNEHASHSEEVATRLEPGFLLIEQSGQIPAMAHLVTHVMGEHLGRWDEGVRLLNQLQRVPANDRKAENEQVIERSIASLELAGGKRTSVADFSCSDQIRILATAACAVAEQGDASHAQTLFSQAVENARRGLAPEDPANRALAVAGNNLACALEERPVRSSTETELMVFAAQIARTYWGIAGAWLQHERAEYRLAKTHLQAGDPVRALRHAQECVEISRRNSAPALELFFGYEVVALAQKALGNSSAFAEAADEGKCHFAALGADDQTWCAAALANLNRAFAAPA